MTCIGLVVALPRELPAGFVRIPEQQIGEWQGRRVYKWTTTACKVVAVQSGMGDAHAAAGAHLLIHRFAPHTLISFGFAGGLVPDLRAGTIVVGDHLITDMSPEWRYHTPPALVEEWCAAANAAHLPIHRGTVVTVKRLVSAPSSKLALAQRTGACAVDMETAGIVNAARQAALPCVTVRAVIDTAEETLPAACLSLMGLDGRVRGTRLLQALWESPGLLVDLLWLARRAATARRHLGCSLKRWAMDKAP